MFGSGWKSQATAPAFFLSKDGKYDPRAELIATVHELFFSRAATSARCRFPARVLFLRNSLQIVGAVSDLEDCPDLQRWYQSVSADSISIDFATSYLERPASIFGHTFLQFHQHRVPTLLSSTSNYAANVNDGVGSVAYALRGLFGGFPGLVDQLPFYRRLRLYGDDQGRDIWEYPLKLTRSQIHLLLLHLWEIRDGVFDYWFMGQNCSYRTLELIAVARPDLQLLDAFPIETIPIDTIRLLDKHGLLGNPRWWPSSVRVLNWHLGNFTHAEKKLVRDLATGIRGPSNLGPRSNKERARIVAAAAEYSSILINRGLLSTDVRDSVTRHLFQERLEIQKATYPILHGRHLDPINHIAGTCSGWPIQRKGLGMQ
jgi:hypothetical protein